MSFPNQPPHMFSYLPPFINASLTTSIPPPAPVIITKSALSAPSNENNNRYSAFERPITTVFIGNISEKIPDSLMKDVLTKCGNVLSWKRVQGASGKLQAFGFCEYDNPEATLRCIRLLNEFSIADKSLVVKVDPKTDELLTEYKNKKQKAIEDREAEDVSKTEEAKRERINAIHAREKDEDNNSLNQIKKLIKEFGSELLTEESDKKPEPVKNLIIDEVDLDGDKKSIISREIENFRNKHKEDDNSEEKEERYQRIRERDKERRKEREVERSDDRRSHRRNKSRSRSKNSKHAISDERSKKRSRNNSRTSSVVSKRRSESKDTHKSHSKSMKDSDKDLDGYEAAVFKKLEKKLREKEAAYQTRLQMWESREKKRIKEYAIEEERKIDKENEIAEEARKLQIFFEDYDDEKWDVKYYRGSELERRYNARRMEEQSDERDRQREVEQIEQTRQRLIKEDNPEAESIILKMEQSMQEHLQKRLALEEDETVPADNAMQMDSEMSPNNDVSNVMDKSDHEMNHTEMMVTEETPAIENVDDDKSTTEPSCEENKQEDQHMEPVIGDTNSAEIINTNGGGDGEIDGADDGMDTKNKAQSSSGSGISTMERNAMVKKIIDGIPTLKADLFAYPIEWKMVDDVFVESRIKPWVDKKIATYIGEEEPSLSMFICKQVLKHRTPDEILGDIAMVLEEEADVFVMKMWRLLIYVIEERKCGLDK